MACSPPRLIFFFFWWGVGVKFQFLTSILNLFIWSQYQCWTKSLTCWLSPAFTKNIVSFFCLTTGCTLTETVMSQWENFPWQQQLHYQEGKCKFLCIMIGSLNQMDQKLRLKGFNNNIQMLYYLMYQTMHLTRVEILCLKALLSKVCHLCHQLKCASLSWLFIPGWVVIALVQSNYAKQWYMTQFSHWLFKSANLTIVLSLIYAHQLLFHGALPTELSLTYQSTAPDKDLGRSLEKSGDWTSASKLRWL